MNWVKGRKIFTVFTYIILLLSFITLGFFIYRLIVNLTQDITVHTVKDRYEKKRISIKEEDEQPRTKPATITPYPKKKFIFEKIDPPNLKTSTTTSTSTSTTSTTSTSTSTTASTTTAISTTTSTTTTTTTTTPPTTTENRWGNTSLDDLKCLGAGGDPNGIGDMHCYGRNNNPDCNYDGYDCCLPVIDEKYCSDVMCRCHVYSIRFPSFQGESDYNCPGDLSFVGDNVCDDELNVYECAYDWWDCCKPESDLLHFCTNCTCVDQPFPPPRAGITRVTDPKDCVIEANNFCEPDQNNELCNWDKGDCCGPTVNCLHPPCDPCHFTKFSLKPLWQMGCDDYLFNMDHEQFLKDFPTIEHMKNTTIGEAFNETDPFWKDKPAYLTFVNNFNWVQYYCTPWLNTKACNYDEGRCCYPTVYTIAKTDCPGFDSCLCHIDSRKHVERAQPTNYYQWTEGVYNHGFAPKRVYREYFVDVNLHLQHMWEKGSKMKDLTWFKSPTSMASVSGIEKVVPGRWSDGVCDEFLNTPFFQYDGGDCCLPKASKQRFMDWTDYNQYHHYQSYEDEKYLHSNLVCHEDGQPLRMFTDFYKEPTCSYVFKDGVCDDFANNEDCFFDGGDCCLAKINSIRCKECECKQEGLKHVTYKDVGCIELKLHDGFCDDDQNHYTCNYDGGDCCMHTQAYANWYATPERVAYFINDFRCTECICKRPALDMEDGIRYENKYHWYKWSKYPPNNAKVPFRQYTPEGFLTYFKQGKGSIHKGEYIRYEHLNPHIWTLYTAEPMVQWMEFGQVWTMNDYYYGFDTQNYKEWRTVNMANDAINWETYSHPQAEHYYNYWFGGGYKYAEGEEEFKGWRKKRLIGSFQSKHPVYWNWHDGNT